MVVIKNNKNMISNKNKCLKILENQKDMVIFKKMLEDI